MKRLFLIFFSFVLVTFFWTSVISAQTPTPDYTNQTLQQWAGAKKTCAENNGVCAEAYTNFMMNSLMYSMSNSITGAGDVSIAKTPEEVKIAIDRSALGTTGKYMGYMFENPPASGIQYIASSLHNFSLGKSAYAQGIGYNGLQPLQPLWRAFRNLSYVVLAIVMVVIGFMIMFRMKLNAQTAISIQNALPNIIVTLVLITFSFAIAGLLIDLMYFLMNLIVSVFVNVDLGNELNGLLGRKGIETMKVTDYQSFFTNANTWDLMQSVINWETITALPRSLIDSGIENMWTRFGTANTWLGDIGQGIGFTAASILNIVGGVLLTFLIALGLLFIFVRLFIMFLNAYIQILLSIILAPIQLLIGAIPGQNAFKNWVMGLIGNLIIFPAAAGLFMLNITLSVSAIESSKSTGTNLWIPPFLFGTANGSNVAPSTPIALIGLGILMLTPSILNTIKGAFAAKPFLPITPGTVISPLMGGVSTIGQLAQQRYYLQQIPFIDRIPGFRKGGGGQPAPPTPSHA